MDEYTEQIRLTFKLDKDNVGDIEKAINEFKKKAGAVGVHQKSKGLELDESSVKKTFLDIFTIIGDKTYALGTTLIKKLGDLFGDALQEFNDMIQYTYLSNQSTRNTMFQYGFSSSQAYAFDKTKQLLGISSDEDLFYMNQQQRSKFVEKFQEYSDKYAKLYDSGFFEKYQETQWELKEFYEDIVYEAMQVIIENKDLIKEAMGLGVKIMKAIVDVAGLMVPVNNRSLESKLNYARSLSTQSVTITSTINNTYENGTKTSTTTRGDSSLLKSTLQQLLALGG